MNSEKLNKALKFIDSFLKLRYEKNNWPGFVVAISHKGKIVFNNAYGYANLERKEKLTKDHVFRIASHSKTFTATAIMQLVEQKRLRLDDCVAQYLPWLGEHKDKRFKKITIKQLLSHGSGIIRDGLDANYWQMGRSFPDTEQLKEEMLEANLVMNPNTQMKYSNVGFSLLGLVIAEVSGMSYHDYINKNMIEPLGLKNTGSELDLKIINRVTGYSRRNKHNVRLPIEDIDTRGMSSATGFYSTSEDLCEYFNAQMIGSGKLLSDGSKKLMQKAEWKVKNNLAKVKYGLGFEICPIGEHELFGHPGGFPGQITMTLCDPKKELVVTVLTNCIDGMADFKAKGIFSILYYFEKNYHLNFKNDLSKFEGRFMDLWGAENVVSMGDRLVSVYLDAFTPFNNPQELEYINSNTLKIVKADGFYAEGELVHYNFGEKGEIKSVEFGGATMLPEKEYLAKTENLTEIKLQRSR